MTTIATAVLPRPTLPQYPRLSKALLSTAYPGQRAPGNPQEKAKGAACVRRPRQPQNRSRMLKCTNSNPHTRRTITRTRGRVLTCVDERTSKGQQEQEQGRQQQGRGRGGASRRGTWPHPAPCCKGGNTHTGLEKNLEYMQPYCDAETSKLRRG